MPAPLTAASLEMRSKNLNANLLLHKRKGERLLSVRAEVGQLIGAVACLLPARKLLRKQCQAVCGKTLQWAFLKGGSAARHSLWPSGASCSSISPAGMRTNWSHPTCVFVKDAAMPDLPRTARMPRRPKSMCGPADRPECSLLGSVPLTLHHEVWPQRGKGQAAAGDGHLHLHAARCFQLGDGLRQHHRLHGHGLRCS